MPAARPIGVGYAAAAACLVLDDRALLDERTRRKGFVEGALDLFVPRGVEDERLASLVPDAEAADARPEDRRNTLRETETHLVDAALGRKPVRVPDELTECRCLPGAAKERGRREAHEVRDARQQRDRHREWCQRRRDDGQAGNDEDKREEHRARADELEP